MFLLLVISVDFPGGREGKQDYCQLLRVNENQNSKKDRLLPQTDRCFRPHKLKIELVGSLVPALEIRTAGCRRFVTSLSCFHVHSPQHVLRMVNP